MYDAVLRIILIRVRNNIDLITICQLCWERNGTFPTIYLCIFCTQTHRWVNFKRQIQHSRTGRHLLDGSVFQIYMYHFFK